jgi:hypothetical protein
MRLLFFVFISLCMVGLLSAQQLNLKVPVQQEARIGQEINVTLEVQGMKNYKLTMEGNPPSASLEGNTFHWVPKIDEKKYYLVTFQLRDSSDKTVNEVMLSLIVNPSGLKPYLIFDRLLADTIKLTEGQPFSFTATIKSQQNANPKAISSYFTFNEDPDLRAFDYCRVNVIGDQLTFYWTPSGNEAAKEYLKFRITLIDTDESVFNQVLNFRIKNINQKPIFKNEIPDTLYLVQGQPMEIDFTAFDPDNDKLKYDYFPKNPEYGFRGTNLLFRNTNLFNTAFPHHLMVTVSDGKDTIKHTLTVLNSNKTATSTSGSYLQPVIGDFTKKIFAEGDSVLTYLNISNYNDLKEYDITYTDLTLPSGINSLAKYLVFEKKKTYIKVYSKGILPYSLVDRDYNYTISILLSGKEPNQKSSFKVLVLTVVDRPDPKNIVEQRDSLFKKVNNFLIVENLYKSSLEKIRNRIDRPWWKKAALITGTLSGVFTLIQSEKSNKTISAISAAISLLAITATNIPSLSEKSLSEVEEKIADSKARLEQVKEKQSEFIYQWSLSIEQSDFDKMKSELEDLIDKSKLKQNEDICSLLLNKKIKKKINRLIRRDAGNEKNPANLEIIFRCGSK